MYPSANAGNWVLILHFSNHHNWVYFAFNTCETLHCCYKLETSLRCLGNFLESFIKEWIIDQSIENSTYSPCIVYNHFLKSFFSPKFTYKWFGFIVWMQEKLKWLKKVIVHGEYVEFSIDLPFYDLHEPLINFMK